MIKIEDYEFHDLPRDWLCINPHFLQPDGFMGVRIFEPQAPFLAGHPSWIYNTYESVFELSSLSIELPVYGWRFSSYHAVNRHLRINSELIEILGRNKKLAEYSTRVECRFVFLEDFLGLFDENKRLSVILHIEEKMQFGL